jgi:hypothetical protein
MRFHKFSLGAIVLLVLFACTNPPRFLLLNNSGHRISVEQDEKNILIEVGQYAELKFDPSLALLWDGKMHKYQWRYPLPPSEYMEFGKPSERFAVSLESDFGIYARKIVDGKPSDNLPSQPPGFPFFLLN